MIVNANRKKKEDEFGLGRLLFCLMSVLVLLLTFAYSDAVIEAMKTGMALCTKTVIPALFPFLVISELLVSSGATNVIGRFFAKPLGALFSLSRHGASVVLLGMLCGFPIGIKSAISLYRQGKISRAELLHLSTFCNNPSSAFLISAVGGTLFGSALFGVLLYLTHIISSFIIGFAGRFYFEKAKCESAYAVCSENKKERHAGFVSAFTNAVRQSAEGMLFICAFVVFFSAVLGALRVLCDNFALPELFRVLLFGAFEMTSGISAASRLPTAAAIPVCAAIGGWSGLSVHFQFIGVCRDTELELQPYFVSRFAYILLNMGIIELLVYIFKDKLVFSPPESINSFFERTASPEAVAILVIFAMAAIFACKKRIHGKF